MLTNTTVIKRSFFERDASSQIIEKFAFIPRYCYYVADFGGVELPLYGLLKQNKFSQSGGENSANPLLQRLTSPFGRAVGGVMMAGALIATPVAAQANDAPDAPEVVSTASVQTVAFEQPTQVSFENVKIVADADEDAAVWIAGDPDRLAVPIRLGLDTQVPPELLESVLREDFEKEDITNIRFFFEVGGPGETSIAYVSQNYKSPKAYPPATARDFVGVAAKTFRSNNGLEYALYR